MKKAQNDGYIKWPVEKNKLINIVCWIDDEPVDIHKHDFFEVVFIAFGSSIHTYRGSDIKLIPGDVFVINPHEDHSYKISNKTVIYNCLFYSDALQEDWDRLLKIKSVFNLLILGPIHITHEKKQEILHLNPIEAEKLEKLFIEMIEDQEKLQSDYDIIQKSNLIKLLCQIGRTWNKQLKEDKIFQGRKRDVLAEAILLIENKIDGSLKVEDIAAKVHLSSNYFRKVFKEMTGLTPTEYINRIRITKACDLLKENDITVSEVAEMVGINNLNYFSRLFKSIMSCSPSVYKNKSKFY